MKRILQDIWRGDGEEHQRPNRSWYAGEDGMIALVTLVAVIFFLILIALVANVGKIVSQKMEVQNGTDSVTYSATLVMARGMNGVTGANHAIGELTALIILHHALGGDELDKGEMQDADSKDKSILATLRMSYKVAENMKDSPFEPSEATYKLFYDDDKQEHVIPKSGATIYRSCVRLEQVLGWTYMALAVGELLWKFREVPYFGPIFAVVGGGISTAAMIVEKKIWLERKILEGLFNLANQTKDIKNKQIHQQIIPQIYNYSEHLVYEIKSSVGAVVEEQRAANLLVETAMDPDPNHPRFALPMRVENTDGSDESLQVSQLTRAAYPWVNNWRHPLLDAMRTWLFLARSAHYYRHYSDLFTYQKVLELKSSKDIDKGIQLYVLKDYTPNQKGTERWARSSGSQRADELFCLTGFGLRDAPRRFAPTIYRSENDDGIMAFAQGMVYNANAQTPSAGLGPAQADVGWDTLNWRSRVPEIESKETIGEYKKGNWDRWSFGTVAENHFGRPEIRLNWQAKLVPVSKLQHLEDAPSGRIGKIIKRLESSESQLRTH